MRLSPIRRIVAVGEKHRGHAATSRIQNVSDGIRNKCPSSPPIARLKTNTKKWRLAENGFQIAPRMYNPSMFPRKCTGCHKAASQ